MIETALGVFIVVFAVTGAMLKDDIKELQNRYRDCNSMIVKLCSENIELTGRVRHLESMSAPQTVIAPVNSKSPRKGFSDRQKVQIIRAYETADERGESLEDLVSRMNATFNLKKGFKEYQRVWSNQ